MSKPSKEPRAHGKGLRPYVVRYGSASVSYRSFGRWWWALGRRPRLRSVTVGLPCVVFVRAVVMWIGRRVRVECWVMWRGRTLVGRAGRSNV